MVEKHSYEWHLGEILIQNKWLSWDQLERALQIQKEKKYMLEDVLVSEGFISAKQGQVLYLGEILIRNGWIDWNKLNEALKIQRVSDRILGEILIEKGFITKENLYRALAIQYNMAYVDFKKIKIPSEVLRLVPARLAHEYRIIPLVLKNNSLLIAISDPKDVKAEIGLKKHFKDYEIHTALALPEALDEVLRHSYGFE